MSGSETIASLWGVSRPSPTPSSCYAALADPKPQCFDVQFMLQMMQDFVADRAVIAQADKSQSLGRQCFVAQSLKGLGGFTRIVFVNGCRTRQAFQLTPILHTQLLDVLSL
jgi:hypothetical protein